MLHPSVSPERERGTGTARGRGHKGLGLAVVFNTVTGPLGGRLAFDSKPGAGTVVTITVPQEL